MSKIQPFRDEAVNNPEDLRVRLNELVSAVNERAPRFRVIRIPNVRGQDPTVVLANPGFVVGAVVMGGITPTTGASPPTAAPWVNNWMQQQDGRITMRIGGLATNYSYVVNLVLYEAQGVSR